MAKATPKKDTKKTTPKVTKKATKKAPKKKPRIIKPENRPLSSKMKDFCHWYVSREVNRNGTEAARRAGYKGNDKTLAVVASENLRKPNVRKLVDILVEDALKGAEVTIEEVLVDLAAIRDLALQKMQLGPAVRAVELRGKYLKMFTDKIEHTDSMEDISMDDLVELAKEISKGGQIDLKELTSQNEAGNGHLPDSSGDTTTH